MSTPVRQMTNKELRAEIEHIAAILRKGTAGTTVASGARMIAVMREAARRMRPETPASHPEAADPVDEFEETPHDRAMKEAFAAGQDYGAELAWRQGRREWD